MKGKTWDYFNTFQQRARFGQVCLCGLQADHGFVDLFDWRDKSTHVEVVWVPHGRCRWADIYHTRSYVHL